ncbi:MAG: low temperature requirement protein A [Chloroflexaceae bacterium]
MMNAHWHPPQLHTAHKTEEERKVTWLELFYDLVYVATIIQLGNWLSDNVSPIGFAGFFFLFVLIWWSWTGITFYINRIVVDDVWHRVLVFVQMFAIAVMAISVNGAFGEKAGQFALAYAGVRLILIALYLRAGTHIPEARPLTRRYATGFALAAVLWIISAFLPAPLRYAFWAGGLALDFATPLSRRSRQMNARIAPDVPHMSERYGLLTIIVLGESFVKVIGSASEAPLGFTALISGAFGMIAACSLWWLYFDNVAGAMVRATGRAPYVWIYSHLPLALGLTAFGVGIKKLVILHAGDPFADKYRLLICGAVILCLVFIALIDLVTVQSEQRTRSQTRAQLRFGAAAVVLLLAFVGAWLPPIGLIALIACACAAPIVIDLLLESRKSGPLTRPVTH